MPPHDGDPIRLGVIGLSTSDKGWAGTLLAPLFPGTPLAAKYSITALCTTSAASATAAAEKYAGVFRHPVRHYYGPEGAKAIANDPNVDVVAVVVNVGDHRSAVLPALERGKDVFVEWPLGKNVKETLEIAELARKKGVRTMVGAQGIQSPVVRKVSDILVFCRRRKAGRADAARRSFCVTDRRGYQVRRNRARVVQHRGKSEALY